MQTHEGADRRSLKRYKLEQPVRISVWIHPSTGRAPVLRNLAIQQDPMKEVMLKFRIVLNFRPSRKGLLPQRHPRGNGTRRGGPSVSLRLGNELQRVARGHPDRAHGGHERHDRA